MVYLFSGLREFGEGGHDLWNVLVCNKKEKFIVGCLQLVVKVHYFTGTLMTTLKLR